MVGDPVTAKRISDILLAEYGVYVQPINYPTVPRRHRAPSLHPRPCAQRSHDARACTALVEIWDRLEMRLAA
jgi:5-aminolevulinate synthase